MEVNINQQCTVVLKKRGIDAIQNHYKKIGLDPPKTYQVGDEYTAPLWDIMNVFGEATYMGPVPPFETTIRIKPL
jgi:hypothetical protein